MKNLEKFIFGTLNNDEKILFKEEDLVVTKEDSFGDEVDEDDEDYEDYEEVANYNDMNGENHSLIDPEEIEVIDIINLDTYVSNWGFTSMWDTARLFISNETNQFKHKICYVVVRSKTAPCIPYVECIGDIEKCIDFIKEKSQWYKDLEEELLEIQETQEKERYIK